MYPHVTQFDTRDTLIGDQLRLRSERRRAAKHPRRGRAASLTLTFARMLRLARA